MNESNAKTSYRTI